MSDNFFNDRLAHYFSPLRFLVQAVQLTHGFYQSASLDDIHQILRKRSNRVLFSIVLYMLIHYYRNLISLFYIVMKIRLLNKKKAVVNGVAEKDPGKRFRNDTLYTQCLDDLRCLLSGGSASEVLPATIMSPFWICPASSGRRGLNPYCFISSMVFSARYSVG